MTKTDILLVDHDVHYLRLFKALAEREGIRVRTASSEEEAWEYLAGHGCRLMLVALDLLGGNGSTLAILAKVRRPELAIAVLTMDGAPAGVPLIAARAGISTAFAKPYDGHLIRGLLCGDLKGAAAETQGASAASTC